MCNKNSKTKMQKATFRIVKGGLLHYELRPFVCQEMAF